MANVLSQEDINFCKDFIALLGEGWSCTVNNNQLVADSGKAKIAVEPAVRGERGVFVASKTSRSSNIFKINAALTVQESLQSILAVASRCGVALSIDDYMRSHGEVKPAANPEPVTKTPVEDYASIREAVATILSDMITEDAAAIGDGLAAIDAALADRGYTVSISRK